MANSKPKTWRNSNLTGRKKLTLSLREQTEVARPRRRQWRILNQIRRDAKKIHECLQATPTKPRELLKTNYKSFTLTCSTKILPYSCRLYRVFLDRVRQNRASQRKVHQPNEKCWKFDCCVTYFSGKVKCFLCNLTRDDKSEVSNLLFVFNTFFSNLCAMIKDTR